MTETLGVPMIEAQGLSKFYGEFTAIRDVTFQVARGQVTAFLGPNGAGKSTTLKILTGYVAPTSGTARLAGMDVATHRIEAAAMIGYLPENGPLYPEMTPLELLRFFGEARGMANGRLRSRIDAVVQQCHLDSVIEKSIHKLSRGYRQRVGMAQVLLHEPDILIMDEPTSGLDPNQIYDVRELIRQLGETKTILLSTHILQEVEAVASHVIVVNEGRIVYDGTPGEMAGGGTLEQAFYRLTGKFASREETALPKPVATAPAPAPEEEEQPPGDPHPERPIPQAATQDAQPNGSGEMNAPSESDVETVEPAETRPAAGGQE
jgi:ABC-2 type transport system ATP-binding protein